MTITSLPKFRKNDRLIGESKYVGRVKEIDNSGDEIAYLLDLGKGHGLVLTPESKLERIVEIPPNRPQRPAHKEKGNK